MIVEKCYTKVLSRNTSVWLFVFIYCGAVIDGGGVGGVGHRNNPEKN